MDENYLWRTVDGVAHSAGVSRKEVFDTIKKNKDIVVESSVLSKTGENLYTTRDHFREQSSSLDKIIGAFKGRIR